MGSDAIDNATDDNGFIWGAYFKFRGTNEIGSECFCIQEKFLGLQSYVILMIQ